MVTRIAGQKGFDLLVPALEQVLREEVQLAILGNGDPALESALRAVADRLPGKFALRVGFDEALAHRIYAGCDAFLMPSNYEPCGLSQLYALRYGSLPIVRATGGLRDTVRDGETGFAFEPYRVDAMMEAIRRARATFANRARWEEMVEKAMRQDFSWDASARAYEAAYERL
jgi:starch synthase